MADATLYAIIVSLLSLIILHSFLRRKPKNLPPGPPSLPIIGHLHLLKFPLHRTLYNLSNEHGPIMSLWFGVRHIMVVSSLPLAEECFTKNDIVLANRPKDEAERLMLRLARNGFRDFHRVELKTLFTELTFNVIMRMISGKRYYGEDVSVDKAEASEFREIIKQIVENGGTSYEGDFLPILDWIDYKGFKKMIVRLGKRADAFLQNLVDEHRRRKGDPEFADSMISHLLRLQEAQPENYSDLMIKALVLVMLGAGTDTTSVMLEWVMTNLLNNPDKLKKAQDEIDSIIGHDRLMEEPDVSKLSYLQCIIFETFRLSTTVPLLVPHESSAECTIGEYTVPRGTIVLVNAWAIHRDPELWEDPKTFEPERFEGGNGEEHQKLVLPFGLGRRACPGAPLAQRVMGLTLGLLLQCFDWKRVSKEEIDMTEGNGLTMPKVVPLELMCKVRPPMENLIPKD
ncbi:cytochrome P450 81E8 [Eucalyptus grandis]|uniref:cytochrome P450 81E8 n=1 Tax=Eucalyptus grandis TaxID=71139 RepID=UPI00192F0B42|nr:cytochrome P450 81E8 [Eucalyptus grandis]